MQDGEHSHTGDEHRDDGKNSSQSCKRSPDKDEELARELAETLLKGNELRVHPRTTEEAPGDRNPKNCRSIKAKKGLIEDSLKTLCCGCFGLGQHQDQHLDQHLNI